MVILFYLIITALIYLFIFLFRIPIFCSFADWLGSHLALYMYVPIRYIVNAITGNFDCPGCVNLEFQLELECRWRDLALRTVQMFSLCCLVKLASPYLSESRCPNLGDFSRNSGDNNTITTSVPVTVSSKLH